MGLTNDQKREMARKWWFVSASNETINQSVAERLVKDGVDVEEVRGKIVYKGMEIYGFFIGHRFMIAVLLAENRTTLRGFEVYSSSYEDGPWAKWKQGVRTPAERLRQTKIAKDFRGLQKFIKESGM